MKFIPLDQIDRKIAATTFDQNIIVTAGAGTGKTTLLINRLIHLLMREHESIQIDQIIALTFTNKSATEMQYRLRETLTALISSDENTERVSDLIQRYKLNKETIDNRSKAAIRLLERSGIGTIHHFATTLLRLYPIEAGVTPQFQIDETGGETDNLFEEIWRKWLQTELQLDNPRKNLWKTVLAQLDLSGLEETAKVLSSESISFASLIQEKNTTLPLPIRHWLQSLKEETSALLNEHPETRLIERMLATALHVFQEPLKKGASDHAPLENEEEELARSTPTKVKGWEVGEFKSAKKLIRIAQQLLHINATGLQDLIQLLNPFVILFRKETDKRDLISFDDLLIKTRNLLRDYPDVREVLKQRYHAILIDEFQDTDPLQYEILLFLAEQTKTSALNWREVKLSPGKLFVVGDPKQSIYGFRQADIEAYHHVQKMILAQNGIACTLRTNFRSHDKILNVVNTLCQELILPKGGLQAPYIPIHPAGIKDKSNEVEQSTLPFRQVSFRSIDNENLRLNAEQGKKMEGEAIAEWLCDSVLGKAMILDSEGKTKTVKPGDVAILTRSLTGIHHTLEALRRAGIKYFVEGEKHFYQNQEVIDAINLLRIIVDPNDRIALVGVLRSPIGGLSDETIYTLYQKNKLNYQISYEGLTSPLQELYRLLSRLHHSVFKLPVGEAVARIFEETPLTLLASAAIKGEQAIANIEKIRHLAEQLGENGETGFREIVDNFEKKRREEMNETESPLAEEGVDAVKVFSIHKSKGLEFPLVILAGCQSGSAPKEREAVKVRHDWSTDLGGLRVRKMRDLNSIFLAEKERLREEEEEKRILYVAMTRAREHLMISSVPKSRIQNGSFLAQFREGFGETLFERLMSRESGEISVGNNVISKINITEVKAHYLSQANKESDLGDEESTKAAKIWEKRQQDYEKITNQPIFTTPSQRKAFDNKPMPALKLKDGQRISLKKAAFIGNLAHRFLERWDFSSDHTLYRNQLISFLKQQSFVDAACSREEASQELETIFQTFFHSPPYNTLTQAEIIGREVPFIIPWEGQVMKGVIDLIYKIKGDLFIAEYKTDRIKKGELSEAAKKYGHQLHIYPEAVKRSLKKEVKGMQLIFLRIGESLQC